MGRQNTQTKEPRTAKQIPKGHVQQQHPVGGRHTIHWQAILRLAEITSEQLPAILAAATHLDIKKILQDEEKTLKKHVVKLKRFVEHQNDLSDPSANDTVRSFQQALTDILRANQGGWVQDQQLISWLIHVCRAQVGHYQALLSEPSCAVPPDARDLLNQGLTEKADLERSLVVIRGRSAQRYVD
ncbi:hypothetical protein [Sphingobacterium suaedae]|uniref:DUF892 family protein n=1 Tax=Sphingobacterium suaedae TaxID=1686402 RepID=A0ABW5KGI1_9SPHI